MTHKISSMSPLERRAEFKKALALHEVTATEAAKSLGVSYNHLTLVLRGERLGSIRLEKAIAAFLDLPVERVFTKTVRS